MINPADARSLVVAVGPTAVAVLSDFDRHLGASGPPPVMLGITAEYPPYDMGVRQDFVYDLGFVGSTRQPFDWCRRSAGLRKSSAYPWDEPIDGRRLHPGQCNVLYEFHQSHGLLPAFWRAVLPTKVDEMHIITDLSDGAACLIPEVLHTMQARAYPIGMLHIHAQRPAPTDRTNFSRRQACEVATHNFKSLVAQSEHDFGCPQIIWIVRQPTGSDECALDQVVQAVSWFSASAKDLPLRDYCLQLKRLDAWREEISTIWGSYRIVVGTESEELEVEEMLSDDCVEYGLPASRVDLMRRILIDWDAPRQYCERLLAHDPGLRLIQVAPEPRTGKLDRWSLCKAWLGFDPSELPYWADRVVANDEPD